MLFPKLRKKSRYQGRWATSKRKNRKVYLFKISHFKIFKWINRTKLCTNTKKTDLFKFVFLSDTGWVRGYKKIDVLLALLYSMTSSAAFNTNSRSSSPSSPKFGWYAVGTVACKYESERSNIFAPSIPPTTSLSESHAFFGSDLHQQTQRQFIETNVTWAKIKLNGQSTKMQVSLHTFGWDRTTGGWT